MANSSYTVIPNNIHYKRRNELDIRIYSGRSTVCGKKYTRFFCCMVLWSRKYRRTILYNFYNGVNWSTYFAMNDIGYCKLLHRRVTVGSDALRVQFMDIQLRMKSRITLHHQQQIIFWTKLSEIHLTLLQLLVIRYWLILMCYWKYLML